MSRARGRLRAVLAVCALAAIASVPGTPAAAHKEYRFQALPCAAVCAHWLDNANTGIDVNDDGEPDVYAEPCEAPTPSWGYDGEVLTAPRWAEFLHAVAYPVVDWDLFLCDGERTVGSNVIHDARLCRTGGLIGCREEIIIPVHAGKQYTLRAYNWSDPYDLVVTANF